MLKVLMRKARKAIIEKAVSRNGNYSGGIVFVFNRGGAFILITPEKVSPIVSRKKKITRKNFFVNKFYLHTLLLLDFSL